MESNPYTGPERRRFERVAVDFTVTYVVHEPLKVRMLVGDRQIEAEVSDLSEIGMSIVTNYDIPIATVLLIKFTLVNTAAPQEKSKTVNLTGEVRYNILLGQAGHRLGINFTEITKEDRDVISSFVRNVLAK